MRTVQLTGQLQILLYNSNKVIRQGGWNNMILNTLAVKQAVPKDKRYILKDEPELKFNAAIEKSMEMMRGNKMKLFLMDLGFFGLTLLSAFTLFIGLLWLFPYWYSARAAFYEDLKNEASIAEQA